MLKDTRAEHHTKGFTCWGQLVAMLFCQLRRAHSLREITGGLRSCEGKLKHLGISAPSHSTLAYANEHRPWELYQYVFLKLFGNVLNKGPKHKPNLRYDREFISYPEFCQGF